MVSLAPGGSCDPCERDLHEECIGWKPWGFCGCWDGLCLLRLMTGVMWELSEPPEGEP